MKKAQKNILQKTLEEPEWRLSEGFDLELDIGNHGVTYI